MDLDDLGVFCLIPLYNLWRNDVYMWVCICVSKTTQQLANCLFCLFIYLFIYLGPFVFGRWVTRSYAETFSWPIKVSSSLGCGSLSERHFVDLRVLFPMRVESDSFLSHSYVISAAEHIHQCVCIDVVTFTTTTPQRHVCIVLFPLIMIHKVNMKIFTMYIW